MSRVEVVDDWRGMMVRMGLGQPSARAFVAASITTGMAYIAKYPKAAFREDGSIKPLKGLSPDMDATSTHFLLLPVAVGTAVFLFT